MFLLQFKKKVSNTLIIQSGKKCTVIEVKNEAAMRSKMIGIILEDNTLFEIKVYNEARKHFLESIQ